MDDAYENESCKFIWGIKAYDDLCSASPCLYTMNDIDIIWAKDEAVYYLEIETAYLYLAFRCYLG